MAKVPRLQLADVIAAKLSKAGSKALARDVAAYLLEEKRTGELDSLARDLVNYRADQGLVEVTAVSAFELNPTALSDVKAKVKQLYPDAKDIIINERLDRAQLGGVRLEFPDKQLDLSIRNKLNRFKQLTTA